MKADQILYNLHYKLFKKLNELLKMKIEIIISITILVKYIFASCPNGILYCFDSNDQRLGQITVGQCWFWSRFNCRPCFEYSTSVKKFIDYLLHCQYYYPKTVKVLDKSDPFEIEYLLDPFGNPLWDSPINEEK